MDAGLHSELEHLILSMAADNIKSGYAMRLQMSRMDGLRWSADSGSVYRVLRRLGKAGFLKELGKVGVPNRERIEYAITPTGRDELTKWAQSELTEQELTSLVDPVRLKARSFGHLSPSCRRATVALWIKQNAAYIRSLKRRFASAATEAQLADSSLLMLAKARQAWLKSLAKSLADG